MGRHTTMEKSVEEGVQGVSRSSVVSRLEAALDLIEELGAHTDKEHEFAVISAGARVQLAILETCP